MNLSRVHERRLRAYYRSAGWPCLDAVEIDLLNAGLIERIDELSSAPGRIRVTDAGLRVLGGHLDRNRHAFDAHEALVRRVALSQHAAGRLVFRGLMLRGRVTDGWKVCRPDVYSIRNTSVAAYAGPVIHEVKVRRADLLADLKHNDKRVAYQALSSLFYYVMPEGLANLDEVPEDSGVIWSTKAGFRLGRASPGRSVELSMQEWMCLARRAAERFDDEPPAQTRLGDSVSGD